jgi:polysaccharide biosynthesis protein PelG
MSSTNITLEAMTRHGALSSLFGAYLYAAMLVAGPWIFTVLGFFCLSTGATCDGACTDLIIFRSVVIYNSMYALIVTSPLAFITARYVADQLHGRRHDSVFYALVVSLSIFALLSLVTAVPFYLYATTLDAAEKIASIQNIAMLGCSWLLIPFLGAFRAYRAVLVAFGVGAISMLVLGSVLRDPPAVSLLLAFNSSFAITNLIMLATVVRRFGSKIVIDPGFLAKLGSKWELPAAGAAYGLGLWIDKVIMWHVAPSGGLLVAGALQTMPSYDTAMFWSQLSSIPIIVVFFVHIETRFSGLLRRFHARLQQRASLRELNEMMRKIAAHVLSGLVGLFAALVVIAGMMIMLSFVFMTELGLRPSYMSILRVSLCSMVFYTTAMFCFSVLLYLDLRRPALLIVLTYLVLNGILTVVLLSFGPDLYGYGNMIASTVSLLVGFGLVVRELPWLHYHAFVTKNASL